MAALVGGRAEKSRSFGAALVKDAPFGLITAVAAALGLDFLGLNRDDAGTWPAVWLFAASEHTLASVLERISVPGSPPVAPA